MPQINFFLEEEEDKIVEKLSKDWRMNKSQTIKKISKEFKFIENIEGNN